MGYAKQLGKQYNANTAWSSLGTDRSAYEQGSTAGYKAIFDYIKGRVPQGAQTKATEDNDIQNYIEGITQRNIRLPKGLGQGFDVSGITNLYDTFAALPNNIYGQVLSGKYMSLF
jgi:hypothetical protein